MRPVQQRKGARALEYRFIMMSLMCVCSAMQMSSPWRVSNWKMCNTPATRILKKTAWLDEPNCSTRTLQCLSSCSKHHWDPAWQVHDKSASTHACKVQQREAASYLHDVTQLSAVQILLRHWSEEVHAPLQQQKSMVRGSPPTCKPLQCADAMQAVS